MNANLDRKEFLTALMDLAQIARSRGMLDEVGAVIGAIRALRPAMVELDLVEGEIALQRGDYHEAIRLLKSVESSPTHWSYAKALRAASLFCLRDPEWQTNVNEVLESQNSREDAVMLARMLVEDDPTEFLNATESAASSEGAPACAVAACDHAMAKS